MRTILSISLMLCCAVFATAQQPGVLNNTTIDGFRPIWFDLGQKTEYGSKYCGSFGTYTVKHRPLAIFDESTQRTYFVYGGTTTAEERHLLCMVSYFDHKSGLVHRPTVVYDKGDVNDPHDNPSILLDPEGYLWIYVSGRNTSRSGFIYRSTKPHDISHFDFVWTGTITYPQCYYLEGQGHFLFFTRYDGVRQLFFQTSPDGRNWSNYKQLASIMDPSLGETKSGHYQVSGRCGNKLAFAFNRHLNGNCDTRTNIYYLQTTDFGKTWTLVDGTPIDIPITDRNSPCRILNLEVEGEDHSHMDGSVQLHVHHAGKNCYIKDLNFDKDGNPIILYLTSHGHKPGPQAGMRQWYVAHYTGKSWQFHHIAESTNNYDSGSLYVEGLTWTVIAPLEAGPQRWGQGGEVVAYTSTDQGNTWKKTRQYTANSPANHCYVRRPEQAKDPFYAFWADGNPELLSPCHLHFADSQGHVWRLPDTMDGEWATPEPVSFISDEELRMLSR